MRLLLSSIVLCCVLAACGSSPSSSELAGDHGNQGQNSAGAYPLSPNEDLTPGLLCTRPTEQRYPERISYCERDVSSGLKKAIIAQYDEELGYTIQQMQRTQFKIDHFIPLCMGGANDRGNLWPQHATVYTKTDGIEQKLCQLMAQGSLTQVKAVEKIRYVKFHLDEAGQMEADLDRQLHR